jgi:CheY-like chemotaxis protein
MARILVIDDDGAVRAAIRLLLERESHEVVDAEDGRSGVDALKIAAFDIVICDIFMPGMDGLETIREFHRHNPHVPVIAMSGFTFRHSAPDFLTMATKLGAAYSLHKPFRPPELLRAVQACLTKSVQAGDETSSRRARA